MLGVLEVKVEGYWQEFLKLLGGEAHHQQEGGGIPPSNQSVIRVVWSDALAAAAMSPLSPASLPLATSEQEPRVTCLWLEEGRRYESIISGLGMQETRSRTADVISRIWEKVKFNFTSYLTWSHCKLRIAGVLRSALCCYCIAAQCLQNGKEKFKYFFGK